MSLTEAQEKGIKSLTIDGERATTACGSCGRETIVAVDDLGRAWWLCSDCLAARVHLAEQALIS